MIEPKRQHYLPRFYLEGFSRDGLIWIFDRETGKYRQDGASNTAVIKNYYSMEGVEGTEKTKIESMFKLIESRASCVIKKLDLSQQITENEWEALAVFIGYLFSRVPQYERMIQKFTEKTVKLKMKSELNTIERAQTVMKQLEEEGIKSPPETTPEEMVNLFQRGEYTIKTPRNISLYFMLDIGFKLANYIFNVDWHILHVTGKGSFITSDAPFTLIPPSDYDPIDLMGVGILTPGSEKLVPLTQKITLVMKDFGHTLNHIQISESKAKHMNLLVASNCDRLIIGCDEASVRDIVKITGIDRMKPGP
jgi:hypothetical protein